MVDDPQNISHLPPEWETWQRDAKLNYLAASATRRGLYVTLADLASFHPRDVGRDVYLNKQELAAIVVSMADDDPRAAADIIRRFR